MKVAPRQRAKTRKKRQLQRSTGKQPWNVQVKPKKEKGKVKPLELMQKKAEGDPRMLWSTLEKNKNATPIRERRKWSSGRSNWRRALSNKSSRMT